MRKTFAFLAVLLVGGIAYAIGPDPDGRTPTNVYLQAPDGGTVRQSADELGRAYVRSVAADGGIPEVALPAGESADDPLHVVPGDGTAAYSAANPLPQSIWGAERGLTPATAATVSPLGADHAGVSVVARDQDGEIIGTDARPVKADLSVDTGAAWGEVLCPASVDISVPAIALEGRREVLVQNLGPNPVYLCPGTPCTVAAGVKLQADEEWRSFAFGSGITLSCIATVADQVSGAGLRYVEVK